MNDDVKAARESIKEFRDWAQRLNQLARHSKDGMSNSLIAADNQRAIEVKTKILLAHIDGEPARIAAACDEAQRGEQEAWRQADQMRAERDDERDQRIVAEVDRDRAHGAREVLGKLLVERDALRAQVEALERERDMLQTALRDNSAAHSETGKMLLRAEAERDAARSDCRKETAHIEHCELKLHNAGLSIDDGLATAIDDLIAERDDWKERAKVPGRSSTKHLEEKP